MCFLVISKDGKKKIKEVFCHNYWCIIKALIKVLKRYKKHTRVNKGIKQTVVGSTVE